MVVLSNTIVNPVAVMVKLVYATVADVAVARILSVDCLTVWTETIGIFFGFNYLGKFQLVVLYHGAWIHERG